MIFDLLTPPQGSSSVFSFCGRVPWLYQNWPGGFMLFVVLCPGTPKGSTKAQPAVVLVLKHLRRRGNG